RGLLFADSVYEGFGILDSQIVDYEYHMDRLDRSLGELEMPWPMSRDELLDAMMQLIEVNESREGFMYLQITRGERDRNYLYDGDYVPNVFAFTQKEKFAADAPPKPVRLATTPDIRWARRDIKTTNLLGQVMAKQAAHRAGAYEALMIAPDGHVTEAGSSSFFFVKGRDLFVRPVSNDILHGITRQTMLRVAETHQLQVREEVYTLEQALAADEAFITAASIYVLPVGRIDDADIGDGGVGPITASLRSAYLELARSEFPKAGGSKGE
ncbi:MAG: aminotransferase class IV, partial [Pseudomonadota bacterium]|nr:aminotransferase class IV [Pseudomonadota bacterium]